jgi:hypothetical protein
MCYQLSVIGENTPLGFPPQVGPDANGNGMTSQSFP